MHRLSSIGPTVFLSAVWLATGPMAQAADSPNIIVIYADDLGWGDLACYGNTRHQTPHLDRMAAEGARLTDFYVSTPSCAPSRAALLTGRFPYRTGVPSNPAPDSGRDHGIRAEETTLAELLKEHDDYATACVGKWHLGHLPAYYPTQHGFDSYFGILYSNDMRPVMLCRNDQAVEYPVVQSYLTQRYTSEALQFIRDNQQRPFFLYLPHAMPHKPLAASEKFYTPETREDLYSDVIRELDSSVGEILSTVAELGLDHQTLVIFASDNGPWFGGSTGGLRGMKGSSWEGGFRVPAIFRWPGRIPSGQVISEPCATIDVLPTVCALVGADAGALELDGVDLMPLLAGQQKPSERPIFCWQSTRLMSIRQGRWKLHLEAPSARPRGSRDETWIDPRGPDGVTLIAPLEQYQPWQYPSPVEPADAAPPRAGMLVDLQADPQELRDVSQQHPEIVQKLRAVAEVAIGDTANAPLPTLERATAEFYLGPGRITPDQPQSIEEALHRTRHAAPPR